MTIVKAFSRTVQILIKLLGLLPFRIHYNNDVDLLESRTAEILYSLGIAIFLSGLVCFSFMNFVSSPVDNINQNTLSITLRIERFCDLSQSILTYFSLCYYRKNQIECINMVNKIHVELRCFCKSPHRYDSEYERIMKYVIAWTMVQSALSIGTWLLYMANSAMGFIQITIITIFANLFSMLLTLMQFGMLIEVAQLYRRLSEKLTLCVARIRQISSLSRRKQMKMQMFCDVSDDIDKIALLYKCVTNNNHIVCQVLSISIIGNVVNSFAKALLGVKYVVFIVSDVTVINQIW